MHTTDRNEYFQSLLCSISSAQVAILTKPADFVDVLPNKQDYGKLSSPLSIETKDS